MEDSAARVEDDACVPMERSSPTLARRGPNRSPVTVAVVHGSADVFAGALAAVDWARRQGADFRAVAFRSTTEAVVGIDTGVAAMFVEAPGEPVEWERLDQLCARLPSLTRLVLLERPEAPVALGPGRSYR